MRCRYSSRFDRVLYADTGQQCSRLADIAAEKNLIAVDELQPGCADVVFIIAVLHVLRNAKERTQLARSVASLRPRYIVVETPRNQCYYKDKLKRGCYRSREGTFYWGAAQRADRPPVCRRIHARIQTHRETQRLPGLLLN
jgi:predicted Fe-S protein YdhL (DUF1289 family)